MLKVATCAVACVGVVVFVTYALVQVTQVADATATFAVYDSDNYPQVSLMVMPDMQCPARLSCFLIRHK